MIMQTQKPSPGLIIVCLGLLSCLLPGRVAQGSDIPLTAISARLATAANPPRHKPLNVVVGDANTNYADPEFWGPTNQMCWQDAATNEIWICSFDPQTGALTPADGRGVLCGVAVRPLPNPQETDPKRKWGSFNGPEWGQNQQGLFVYFTVYDQNDVMQSARFGPVGGPSPTLVQISQGGTRGRGGSLPTSIATLPFGGVETFLFDFPNPPNQVVWRFENELTVDRTIPVADVGLKGPRWIPGELAMATNVVDGSGKPQTARYDVINETLQILTNDDGRKIDNFIIFAPDRGKRVLVCRAGTREVRFYEEDAPYWKKIGSVQAPYFWPGGGFFSTVQFVEPFILNDKVHITFTVGIDLEALLKFQIFLTGLSGAQNGTPIRSTLGMTPEAIRQTSPPSLLTQIFDALLPSRIYVASLQDLRPILASEAKSIYQTDPEVVVTGGKALLYYYSYPTGLDQPAALHVVQNLFP